MNKPNKSTGDSKDIVPGLYESPLTLRLRSLLGPRDPRNVSLADLDDAEAPTILAAHLAASIRRALKTADSFEKRIKIVNEILGVLENIHPGIGFSSEALSPAFEKALLEAVFRDGETAPPPRPSTPLSESCLFTGAAGKPQLANELANEMQSADRVDILVSFIKRSGVTLLMRGFETLRDRNVPVRIITTCYMGASDPEAIEALARFPNVEIKVSYDTKHTRLHAKAYYFHRKSGFSTAYVGSSNMSNPAMSEGLEWNIKATASDLEPLLRTFEAEFEGYWNSESFEDYSTQEKEKFRRAIADARNVSSNSSPRVFFDISPRHFQSRILEALQIEREVRKSSRNLVVAATGTGKTVIAGLDYRAYCEKLGNKRPRLLFIAHRDQILDQNREVFRAILRDPNFGARMGGPHGTPEKMDHLFCTIQTANSQKIWEKLDREFYDFIIVDEAHHAPASSYQGIFDGFSPKILLGLTATPERMDGESILPFFNNKIATELRLPEALEEKLLCPFQYFGVSDPVSIAEDKYWQLGKFVTAELEQAYVDDQFSSSSRLSAIFNAVDRYRLGNIDQVRGLGFCVSIRHAEFMAQQFSARGVRSLAVISATPEDVRGRAINALEAGDVKFLFTVDLFNEGIDVPDLNTVLFLRPTDSLTVFLQQLGRGLRHSKGKDALLVLDFVAQMHRRYRIDRKFAALLPGARFNIQKEIEHGFPHVPPGCSIQLEKQAMESVIRNIKAAYANLKVYVPEAIRTFERDSGRKLTLGDFLEVHGIEPERLLKEKTWTEWKALAGVVPSPRDPDLEILRRAVARVSQISGPRHLREIAKLPESGLELIRQDLPEANMIYSMLWEKIGAERRFPRLEDAFRRLELNSSVLSDLRELSIHRQAVTLCSGNRPYQLPLELHAHYSNVEIQAAFGRDTFSGGAQMGVGLLPFHERKAFAVLITLNKSEKDFSPSTLYQDYPISLEKFHWESPSTTTQGSPTGQKLLNHHELGYKIFLFVRLNKSSGPLTAPFQFLGAANVLSHSGERPISIVLRLEHPMPADLLEAKRVGG